MTETPKVYAAISAVMAHMAKEGISKNRRNAQQGYNFRGIDDVYNALGTVLAENQLVILPRVIGREREERQTQKGGMLLYTILTVEFDLVSAEDGSKHTVCTIGEAMDSADKSSNKAQSAALKYAAIQVFCIPTEGDNDADATTHDVRAKGERTPEPTAAQSAAKVAIDLCQDVAALDKWAIDNKAALDAMSDGEYQATLSCWRARRAELAANNKPADREGGNPFPEEAA